MVDFIYPNARAKALENTLLGKDRLFRMAESVTVDEALKILSEVNFGEGTAAEGPLDFEHLINAEQVKFFSFIREVCPSDKFKKFFLIKNDYHNAEAAIKAKHLKIDVFRMLLPDGIYKAEDLVKKIDADDYRDFPETLSAALSDADSEFVAGKATGQSISALFTKALYKELAKCVKNNNVLKDIFEMRADCANIGTALRDRDYMSAKNIFVTGGILSENVLKSLCEENFDVLKEKSRFFPRSDLIVSAISDAEKNLPLSFFEKYADSYALKRLEQEKYSSEGMIPFMHYCFYKSAEIENVRIILVGILNGCSAEDIKGRLRKTYEG